MLDSQSETAIRSRLSEIAALYPFQKSEEARTHRRPWILGYAKTGGVGAEIGVFRGHFSRYLASILRPRCYYLIDPWTKTGERFTFGGPYSSKGKLPTAVALEEVVLKARLWPGTINVTVIEDYFPSCIDKITGPLDWIYLDASHKYTSTLAELHAAAQLLTCDGVIMGDDWAFDPSHFNHGVFRAVTEFLKTQPFELLAAGPEGQWCIRRSTHYAT